MAITFDASTNLGNTTGTSLTGSHPCTGANRILHVAVGTPTPDNTDYVTGVTYNSVAMTRVDAFHSPGQGGVYLYELVAPATGSNTVAISTSGSVPIYGVALSHAGVLQTGQPDSSNGSAADPTTSLTVNTTVVAANSWLVSCGGRKTGSSDTIAAGANTTARTVNAFIAIGDSNASQAAGARGQTWTLTGSNGLGVCVVSIAPYPDTGSGFFAVL